MNNGKSWDWRIEPMTAQVELYAGHCRAKGCHALAQVFVVYTQALGRQGALWDMRRMMCRAHAEAAVAKHATQEKV